MKIIIIGGGETGFSLANVLGDGYDITIIEKDTERAKSIANKTSALTVEGDGTDLSVLKEAEISKADALIAVTGDDKANLMVCEIANSEKVKKIISLVNSPKNEELFTKLGIHSLVSVVRTNVTEIKNVLMKKGEERIIAEIGDGEIQLIEQTIAKGSKLIGKKAKIKGAVVATIYRSGELIIPSENSDLKEGDVLLVAVKTKDLHKVADIITGK